MISLILPIMMRTSRKGSKYSKSKIIFKDLSYKVNGIFFDIFKELGGAYDEKIYQRAVETKLKIAKINYEREKVVDLVMEGVKIG